jgi:hypothetical protein
MGRPVTRHAAGAKSAVWETWGILVFFVLAAVALGTGSVLLLTQDTVGGP